MPDIYESFTEQETTSTVLDEYRIINFAYDDKAFQDNDVTWKGYYDYNANNNIEEDPKLPDEVLSGGFNRISGVLKRAFTNHYFGRISYNLNKTVQALRNLLGSFKSDYSENISEYSEYAGYSVGDVCYRLNDDEITFYRCVSAISAPAGDFNGVYWEKPEEVQSYDRPAVGVPVLWFRKVPDWAIRFDDGGQHRWVDCPALNFTDFKNMVTLTADGFRVPNYIGKVPMFEGGDNEVQTSYSGDDFTACVQPHAHTAPAVTVQLNTESISHVHTGTTASSAGSHKHLINPRCKYDGTANTNTRRLPVDDIDRYNPATLTNYGGAHTHEQNTGDGNVNGHTHSVTVTGQTGAIKETTGGNPDGFQCCWIVRYR